MSTLGFRHNTVGKGAKPVVKRTDNSAGSAIQQSAKSEDDASSVVDNLGEDVLGVSLNQDDASIAETGIDVSGHDQVTADEGSGNLKAELFVEFRDEILNELRKELRGFVKEELKEELLATLREEISEQLDKRRIAGTHSE